MCVGVLWITHKTQLYLFTRAILGGKIQYMEFCGEVKTNTELVYNFHKKFSIIFMLIGGGWGWVCVCACVTKWCKQKFSVFTIRVQRKSLLCVLAPHLDMVCTLGLSQQMTFT